VTERAQAGRRGRSKLPLSKDPDAGLDPSTLGSRPEPKADP